MSYRYKYNYHTASSPVIRPKRRIHFRSLFVFGCVAVVAGIIIWSHIEGTLIISTADAVARPATHTPSLQSTRASAAIRAIIAADTTDTIGVAIEDISTSSVATYGAVTPFEVASTEKVLSAVTYYHLVEKGTLSLDSQVGNYPASYQIREMVNDSDNDSWNAINDALGGDRELQAYANLIGLHYNVDGNTMRPQDMATLLTKLYSGRLLNSDHTKQLLSYMQNTNDETLIPSIVPDNVTVFHKYGELDNIDAAGDSVLHDAAIVTDGTSPYAIVIYTSGQSSEANRTNIIQQIARQALTVCGW